MFQVLCGRQTNHAMLLACSLLGGKTDDRSTEIVLHSIPCETPSEQLSTRFSVRAFPTPILGHVVTSSQNIVKWFHTGYFLQSSQKRTNVSRAVSEIHQRSHNQAWQSWAQDLVQALGLPCLVAFLLASLGPPALLNNLAWSVRHRKQILLGPF